MNQLVGGAHSGLGPDCLIRSWTSRAFRLRWRLLILIVSGHIINELLPASCVVVDGTKKEEISALRNQKSNETQNIDKFNTHLCGMADPNSGEHEFLNMAREGQFPWFVSFQIKIMTGLSFSQQLKESNKTINETKKRVTKPGILDEPHKREDLHFCSGALISDKWVLSAAHCFVDETLINYMKHDKLKAVAGSHKVSSRSSLNKNLTIKRIYYHSKFNKSMPIGFDIALVELDERSNLTNRREQNDFGEQRSPFMNAICLPKSGHLYKKNDSARIAGWGSSKAKDAHTMPSKLLFTDILLADKANCSATYSKRLKTSEPNRRDDFLCASYKTTRDSCQADSGGPLMQYVKRKAIVIGIVSYGIACATQGIPGVYTRTSAYIDWIENITRNGPKATVEFKTIERESGQIESNSVTTTTTTSTTTTSTSTQKPLLDLLDSDPDDEEFFRDLYEDDQHGESSPEIWKI